MSIHRITRKVVGFWVKDKLERYIDCYLGMLGFSLARKGWCATRIASTASLAVIDGYPRSANSFAVKAFMEAQGGFVRVGNHTHSPANLIRGVRLGKPVLMVIRDPRDAILGYCAWCDETEGEMPHFLRRLQLRIFAKRYVQFHRKLIPYSDSMVVADFNDVITDYGQVIAKVNLKFKTEFKLFEHNDTTQSALFKKAPAHLSPSLNRKKIKEAYESDWEELKNSRVVTQAYELYHRLK